MTISQRSRLSLMKLSELRRKESLRNKPLLRLRLRRYVWLRKKELDKSRKMRTIRVAIKTVAA